ncbi:MAG: hypothetical protein AB7U45_05655 [Desulfamplus sp.]
MNINSYSGYSSSLLNPYASVSNSQPVSRGQDLSSSQDTQNSLASQQSTQQVNPNDFSVNISDEARQLALNETQSVNMALESESVNPEVEAATASAASESLQAQQTQESKQQQQVQQEQQIQSQFYQSSPYGQIPLSRSNIDLMA